MKDHINDMLTRIRNGQKTKLNEIILYWPTPTICLNILKILQKEGFIRGFKKVNFGNKDCIAVLLKYSHNNQAIINKITKISKLGQRIYIKSTALWKSNSGRGIYILSTSKGIISDNQARFLNVGGEILLYIE